MRIVAYVVCGVGIVLGWLLVALLVYLLVRGYVLGHPVGSDDPYLRHPAR